MRRGRERRHRFIPGVKSRRAKRIYMGTLRTTAVRMDNTEERPSLLDRFLLTRSVSTTCTATSGSGLKTVGTETTTVRPRTAPRGEVASVRAVFFGRVLRQQSREPARCQPLQVHLRLSGQPFRVPYRQDTFLNPTSYRPYLFNVGPGGEAPLTKRNRPHTAGGTQGSYFIGIWQRHCYQFI
jgi:hypothetical protein